MNVTVILVALVIIIGLLIILLVLILFSDWDKKSVKSTLEEVIKVSRSRDSKSEKRREEKEENKKTEESLQQARAMGKRAGEIAVPAIAKQIRKDAKEGGTVFDFWHHVFAKGVGAPYGCLSGEFQCAYKQAYLNRVIELMKNKNFKFEIRTNHITSMDEDLQESLYISWE